MRVLENCEPKRVFYHFEEICGIPHGSGNMKQISDYLVEYAKSLNLKYVQDDLYNVIIYKPATEGYENAPTVILQGHMDMVCEKKPEIDIDFEKDGLNISVADGFIHANGTTLGGDNGIAVAYCMALLESTDIPHPALEVVITVNEEIGLLGAEGIDCSVLKGKRMINLDSEAEGNIWVSCAGGMSGVSHIPVRWIEGEGKKVQIKVKGLLGGHSGAEIDKNRANANILMGRLLYALKEYVPYEIVALSGGKKDNAITRSAVADIMIADEDFDILQDCAARLQSALKAEYAGCDEGIAIDVLDLGHCVEQVLFPTSREKVVFFLAQVPFGVEKMSGTIENLVETSTNLGVMNLTNIEFYASSCIRSSIESARDALSAKVEYLTEFLGGEYVAAGVYPAWEYRVDSPLRDKMSAVYEAVYGEKAKVVAIHAGLECGLFYKKIEGLDCVSIGPNMKDIHTSEEMLDIASTERVWKYLLKVLEVLKD